MKHIKRDPRKSKAVNIYYCSRLDLVTESCPVAKQWANEYPKGSADNTHGSNKQENIEPSPKTSHRIRQKLDDSKRS